MTVRRRLVGVSGCVLFAVLFARFVSLHGTRWEFDRHGLPTDRVDAAGRYPDGTPADAVTALLVRRGWMETATALAAVAIVAWGGVAVRTFLSCRRALRRLAEVKALLRSHAAGGRS